MSYFTEVGIRNSPILDAFSRLRVGTPTGLFDSQFTYNLNPLVLESVTSGSGSTVTHDSTNRTALMTFSSTPTGGKAYLQSYECFRYQPGKSQAVSITFNFIETKADTLKFVGYSDGTNGVELQQSGSTIQLKLYSGTSIGDQTVTQANWNVDAMNGSGPSGKTLDLTKTQILLIDMQALYVGRVRVCFDINGQAYPVHEFRHANLVAAPYIQSANLPIRCGMTCTGTVSTTMNMICCAVVSEGGSDDTSGRGFSQEGTVTAATSQTHVLSVRPKTTFNSIVNRVKFELDTLEIMVTGSNPVKFEVGIGQAITGTTTFNDVNTTYSAFEYNTAGTISGSPAIVLSAGYCAAGASVKTTITQKISNKYPITLDAAGAARLLGTLSVVATAYTGTSALRVTLNWKEIR